jgi:tellurite resistance protein TerC
VSVSIWFWIAFHLVVFVALAVDLFSDGARERIGVWSATWRSLAWVALSLSFNAFIWWQQGSDQAIDFLTGYLIEYSLSVDNIFVFGVIFSYFRVPPRYEHRVLLWGILGALLMRATMIWLGVALVSRFHFVIYLFGIFLLATGLRMLTGKSQPVNLERNRLLLTIRRVLPVTNDYHGPKFFALVGGRRMLTPLALVLIVIETMDLVFAIDSIPAVLAITRDTFIVYTSNICAILGLRSLYFLLANLMTRLVYLRFGLAIILCFVGLKMLLEKWVHLRSWMSLLIIATVLAITTVASFGANRKSPGPV